MAGCGELVWTITYSNGVSFTDKNPFTVNTGTNIKSPLTVFTDKKSEIGRHLLKVTVHLKDYPTAVPAEALFYVQIFSPDFYSTHCPDLVLIIGVDKLDEFVVNEFVFPEKYSILYSASKIDPAFPNNTKYDVSLPEDLVTFDATNR